MLDTSTVTVALILVTVAYLMGSLPFGLWLTRAEGVDLRASGSGNTGATNVWRTSGGVMAAVVLALDMGKGAVPVLLARAAVDDGPTMAACAVAAVVGHVWPIAARFHGGKGVATAAGAFGSLVPVTLGWEALVFLTALAMSRRVSVGSIAAAVLLPVATLLVDRRASVTVAAVIVAALIVWRHRANIARLRQGIEPPIRFNSTPTSRRRAPFVG